MDRCRNDTSQVGLKKKKNKQQFNASLRGSQSLIYYLFQYNLIDYNVIVLLFISLKNVFIGVKMPLFNINWFYVHSQNCADRLRTGSGRMGDP